MKNIKKSTLRSTVQLVMLIVVIVAALNHYLSSIDKAIPWISESTFHYICPICGVTTIYQFLTSSTLFVVKLKSTLGIIIGLVIMASVLFGPIICGFICPFGAIQDFTAKLGKRIFKRRYNNFISNKLHDKLKYLRYVMLILAIILTGMSGGVMLLEKINPYHGFLSIFKGTINFTGLAILAIIIGVSLFEQRPWCKYLCPYGAFLGLFNKIKVFRIVRQNSTCVGCKKCSRQCPMKIEVHSSDEVRELGCISCFECVDYKVCPKYNTISCSSDDFDNNKIKIIDNEIIIK